MDKKILSQEALKLIACVTMLLDHIGAIFFPAQLWLRCIGRMAFPIYCFLLAEGAHYTKNPHKYGLRLLVGLLLAELPYDLAFRGGFTWATQSVMFTLLLGFLMLRCMRRIPGFWKILALFPFALAARYLRTDYSDLGICMIALFALTREIEERTLVQTLGLLALGIWRFQSSPLQILMVLAMVPISLYSGKKSTASPALQWAFYLFYPLHLLILWAISQTFLL